MRAARANRVLGCNKCQWRKESGCKICQKYGGSQNPLTQEVTIFWESDMSQAIVPLALFNAVENLGGYSRVSKLNLWETVHRCLGLSAHKGHSQERISAFIKSALNTAYEGYFPKYKGGTRYAAFAYKTSPILKEGHSALRKEWQCSICDRKPTILPRVHSLFCHKYIEGKNINTHLCLDCNYKTESIEMMKIHLRAHRGGDTGLHEFGTNNSFMQGMPGM